MTAPKPVRSPWSLDAKVTRTRLYSSILVTILCALLGFGYVIQINNTTSTYETMSEDELTKLISETNAQVQSSNSVRTNSPAS